MLWYITSLELITENTFSREKSKSIKLHSKLQKRNLRFFVRYFAKMSYVGRLVYPCLTIIKLCLLFQSLSLSREQHFCYAFENPLMRESHVTIILLLRRWQLSKYYALNHSSEQLEKAFANLVRFWNKVIQ